LGHNVGIFESSNHNIMNFLLLKPAFISFATYLSKAVVFIHLVGHVIK